MRKVFICGIGPDLVRIVLAKEQAEQLIEVLEKKLEAPKATFCIQDFHGLARDFEPGEEKPSPESIKITPNTRFN